MPILEMELWLSRSMKRVSSGKIGEAIAKGTTITTMTLLPSVN